MSSSGVPESGVLYFPTGGAGEHSGLGLVSALLELPELGEREGEEAGEGAMVQRGRQWFAEGELRSPAVMQHGPSARVLRKRGGTSERIQQSLSQLDEVLSPPLPSSSRVRSFQPTALDTTPMASSNVEEGTPTPPALWHNALTPQGEPSMMDKTGILQNLILTPTPAHDRTHMPAHISHSGLHGSQLLEETILGERESTMVEDPSRKVAGDLIMTFHHELSSYSSPSQSLDMAMALEKCCEVQWNILTDFEKQTRLSVDQLLSELRLERATWQLLHVLGRDRVEEGRAEKDREGGRLVGEGASDKELADNLFKQDSSVRQAQLVVDWLEGVARMGLEQYPAKAAYFTDTVCWENTLHDLSHSIDSDLLVTEMDPDAPTRQQRRLSELDASDERSLNKHLFTCIRAGQLDKALGMCVNSGQPLKAVMLEGWKLQHDPNIHTQSSEKLGQVEGNEFRDVWKASCWQMLDEPTYDIYEKAMFAALSGNVQKIIPACQTWYDHVWAYFKTLVDVQVEKALRGRSNPSGRDLTELPSEYWSNVLLPHQIFQEIEASPSADIRQQCQTHFHMIQEYIILDDMMGLVEEMFSWLQEAPAPSIHRLRFMAHIGLVTRGLGRVREESKVNAILEAYVKALTEGHYQSAVALYAAQLPTEAQVKSYAYLLAGIQQEDKQRHCLELGKEAGLDIAMVTKTVVENIRDTRTGEEVCAGSVELGQEVKLTELDRSKIKAINWLVYEEAQRAEAIRQGNTLIRQFLTARKFSAARAVFQKIPPDSAVLVKRLWQQQAGVSPLPQHIASDLTELQAIRTYLEAKEAFNAWFQHFHHKKPVVPPEPTGGMFCEQVAFEHSLTQYKLEYEQWRLLATFLTEEASSRLYGVLVFPGGWMSGHSEAEPEGDRDEVLLQQLQSLRQTCIPEVCFLLHSVLHSSALYKKCLQISDVITSDTYMLYKDFSPSELRQLLLVLQRSAISLISDPTTDELGYLVA